MIDPVVTILDNGIMHVHYPDGMPVDIHAVRKVLTQKRLIAPGRKVAILFEGSRGNPLDKEMRDFTVGPEVTDITIAAAFIANNPFGRFLLHLYLDLTSLPYPARAFRNRDEAMVWLLEMQSRAGLGSLPRLQQQFERVVQLDNYSNLVAGNKELQRDLDVALAELHRLHQIGPADVLTDKDRQKAGYIADRLAENWDRLWREIDAVPELRPHQTKLKTEILPLLNQLEQDLRAIADQ